MSTTVAKCGHSVPAVGAPGSIARKAVEGTVCPECLQYEMAGKDAEYCNSLPADRYTPEDGYGEWLDSIDPLREPEGYTPDDPEVEQLYAEIEELERCWYCGERHR